MWGGVQDDDSDPRKRELKAIAVRNTKDAYQLSQSIAERLLQHACQLTRQDVCELQQVYLRDLPDATDGALRTVDNYVGTRTGHTIFYTPPPATDVASLLDDALFKLSATWDQQPIVAAAYGLWRMNWIHPWLEGNGRVARSVAYIALCVGGRSLLNFGTTSIPMWIETHRYDYQDGLVLADKTFKATGTPNLDKLEELVTLALNAQEQSAQ